MAKHLIIISKKAQKVLDKFSDHIAEPILEAISNLEDNPTPIGYKKLKGRDGYRIRVGNYRIIYEIYETELVIEIIDLGHRKDIYE